MRSKEIKGRLLVQKTMVAFMRTEQSSFIHLFDIARVKNLDEPKEVVENWLRSRPTLDFLVLWEQINAPSFKGGEFDSFKNQAGTNSFTLSPSKWVEANGAVGIRRTAGRIAYAHQDIAFEFASWVSAEFKSSGDYGSEKCTEMVASDLVQAKQHALLKQHCYYGNVQ